MAPAAERPELAPIKRRLSYADEDQRMIATQALH